MRPSQPREHPVERSKRRRLDAAAAAAEVGQEAAPQRHAPAAALWQPLPGGDDRAAASQQQPPANKQAWNRIGDSSMPKGQRGIAWRIMHGSLACSAFQAWRWTNLDRATPAYCSAASCSTAGHFETLTHLCLDCPSIRPALTWLLSTWHSISGVQLPADWAIILGDDPLAWPAGSKPTPAQHTLWTRLRIAFLHSCWTARGSLHHDSPEEHAAAVAAAVVVSLQDQIRSDWLRVVTDIRTSTSACSSWFRGRDPELKEEDFLARGAVGGVLCESRDGNLVLHLSRLKPVPISAAVAAGQPPGA